MITDNEKTLRFRKFFLENFPKVKAFAWKILKSEDDAEDIAQDIFVKLWDKPELWIDRDRWDSYLFSMLKNYIYNFLAHKSVELHYIEDTAEKIRLSELDVENDMTEELYAKEINLLLKMAVEQMPEQRRKIFVLSRYRGLSNQEIADKLQLSVRTVERHLYLALQDLKKIILFLKNKDLKNLWERKMSTISQYTFTNAFNTDKLTQRQVQEMGVQSYTIQAADTDGNGELSFEEIIANTTLCDDILAYIASTNATTQQAAPKEVQQAPQEEPSISYEA